jgi:cytochrome oxidase assembly protein ShyY1
MGAMVRRLLTARWVGLTVVALVLVVAFVLLGFWQLSRAHAFLGHPDDPGPVSVQALSPATGELPAGSVGRRVTAAGTYDPAHAMVVPDRSADGASGDGYWSLGVLRLADGSGLLVVRGWLASPAAAPALPSGSVVVSGRLVASEPADGGRPPGEALPSGAVAAVNPVNLLQLVPYQLHDGFLVAASSEPADAGGLTAVHADPPGTAVPGFFWQHAGYVGLWWLFAVFVVAFWVRLLRDDLHDEAAPLVGAGPPTVPG